MIHHVIERCVEAGCFSRVVVATDDQRIFEAVNGTRATAVMTSPECASGTDRVAEVARSLRLNGAEVLINVQGDEPAVHPESLRRLAATFDDPAVEMATLVRVLHEHERANPNVVKAVLAENSDALYFSRADLPFTRDGAPGMQRWAHLGLYGYRAATLHRLAALTPTALERSESLEQLRALGHGIRIACRSTSFSTHAVDSPSDVPLAEAALNALNAVVGGRA